MKEKSYNDISVIPIYLLLFTSVDTVLFGTNRIFIFNLVPRIISLIMIIIFFLKKPNSFRYVKMGSFFAFITMIFTVLVSGVINMTSSQTIIARLLMIIVGYSITQVYKFNQFAKIFVNFMCFVCSTAIIFEMIAYIFPTLIYKLPIVINTANKSFATLGIGSISLKAVEAILKRANGIFWEPGAFSIYCSIAIIFELLVVRKKEKQKNLIVIIIAFLLTFSTTGIISMSVFFIFWLFTNNEINRNKIIKKYFSFFLILLIIGVIFCWKSIGVYNILFDKILNAESTSITRVSSIINSIQIIRDYPLFGIGQNNMREFMANYAETTTIMNLGTNPMNTNTTLYYFTAYGIFFGSVFVIGLIKLAKRLGYTKLMKIGVFLTIILLFCGETFYSFFPFLLVFYGWHR